MFCEKKTIFTLYILAFLVLCCIITEKEVSAHHPYSSTLSQVLGIL